MTPPDGDGLSNADDVRTLGRFGYTQELSRVLGGFSNFAVSLSIICILAGGLTSFHVGYGSVGGAAIGIGWPLMGLLSLAVAATMAQIASAFPTAGGLYHWASLLGGRGWGWATAWFNLLGLVAVLAAINVGTVLFAAGGLFPDHELTPGEQLAGVAAITFVQALLNHLGVRVTRVLTDFSGWWILGVAAVLTVSLLAWAQTWDWSRLVTVSNFSGRPAGDAPVWPRVESVGWLFALGLLLPAYTITGFDASAHVSEETVNASRAVPRGIVRSVGVSVLAGWVMLAAIVLAMPDPAAAADQGDKIFLHTLRAACPPALAVGLLAACVVAQFLCGLATVTSASRMAFAFARDGGLPASAWVRRVSPRFRSPAVAIWVTSVAAVLFTAYASLYTTIAAVCVIFLYVSYVLPTAAGLFAYGRSWTAFGPWTLGPWFRPLAVVSIVTCVGLIVVGMQPPNDRAGPVVLVTAAALAVGWFGYARRHFPGPPVTLSAAK
jgi:amino acid transporter